MFLLGLICFQHDTYGQQVNIFKNISDFNIKVVKRIDIPAGKDYALLTGGFSEVLGYQEGVITHVTSTVNGSPVDGVKCILRMKEKKHFARYIDVTSPGSNGFATKNPQSIYYWKYVRLDNYDHPFTYIAKFEMANPNSQIAFVLCGHDKNTHLSEKHVTNALKGYMELVKVDKSVRVE